MEPPRFRMAAVRDREPPRDRLLFVNDGLKLRHAGRAHGSGRFPERFHHASTPG